jgi:hypothetical protein
MGEGRMAKFDNDGKIVFGDEQVRQQATPVRRLVFAGPASQNNLSQNVSPMNLSPGFSGSLDVKVDFVDESPIVRGKIEMILNYIHKHITTTIKEKEMVS